MVCLEKESVQTALCLMIIIQSVCGNIYKVDDSRGHGRRFDGIGGISGGSGTSKLLIGYPEKERNEILDYLFLPKFGASLQMLKVEIGAETEGSDATEACHMRNSWEEDYNRGYNWWLMKEAKKRNPNITLYGLPWGFPGWVANGTHNTYYNPKVLADYVYRWVNGAKVHHNLTIDYVGIWNERHNDLNYIKILRETLDARGYKNTIIVGGDIWWQGFVNVYTDKEALSNIGILGTHYPGVKSPAAVQKLGKPLWSSEDYSTYNDNIGGGCWARIINQNYVQGLMTSTISWFLIDSLYDGLPWKGDGLMTAREPWSGNYVISSPIWVSAHTTQFTETGWNYLQHDSGVGFLANGGSYVTLVNSDKGTDIQMTIVIETMSHDHSKCIRPSLPAYNVTKQSATFQLEGSLKNISMLYRYQSILSYNVRVPSTFFKELDPIKVVNGKVTVSLGVDQMVTLSTVRGSHGQHGVPPPSKPFPLPFFEDFDGYQVGSEPYLLAPQQGYYEVTSSDASHGNVLEQKVLATPISNCEPALKWNGTVTLLATINSTEVGISVDGRIGAVNGSNGLFLGVRMDQGGCNTWYSKGIYFYIFPKTNSFLLTKDINGKQIITQGKGKSAILKGWNKLTLRVKNNKAVGTCNGVTLFNTAIPSKTPAVGFAGVGTDAYGIAQFDNLRVNGTVHDFKE